MCPNQNFGLMLAIVSMCPINIGVQISIEYAGNDKTTLALDLY
jgi:hypothetical protein